MAPDYVPALAEFIEALRAWSAKYGPFRAFHWIVDTDEGPLEVALNPEMLSPA